MKSKLITLLLLIGLLAPILSVEAQFHNNRERMLREKINNTWNSKIKSPYKPKTYSHNKYNPYYGNSYYKPKTYSYNKYNPYYGKSSYKKSWIDKEISIQEMFGNAMSKYPGPETEEVECFCSYKSDIVKFNDYYYSLLEAGRNAYLKKLENSLKREIEKELNKNFSNYEEAIKYFFNDYATPYMYHTLSNRFFSGPAYEKEIKNRANIRQRNYLENEFYNKMFDNSLRKKSGEPITYDFGDLTKDGVKLNDINVKTPPSISVNSFFLNLGGFNYSNLLKNLIAQKKYEENLKESNQKYWDLINAKNGYNDYNNKQKLSDWITQKFVDNINSKNDYRERVETVLHYLIDYKDNNRYYGGGPYLTSSQGFSYQNFYSMQDVSLNDIINTVNNLMPNHKKEYYNINWDFNTQKTVYAIQQLPNKTKSFIFNKRGYTRINRYLSKNQFSRESLDNVKDFFTSISNGKKYEFPAHRLKGFNSSNKNSNPIPEVALRWYSLGEWGEVAILDPLTNQYKFIATSPKYTYRGIGELLENESSLTYKYPENKHFESYTRIEGGTMRSVLTGLGIDSKHLEPFSDLELGTLFDFKDSEKKLPFMYKILGDHYAIDIVFSSWAKQHISDYNSFKNKMNYTLFTDPYYIWGLKEILKGNTVNFEDKIFNELTGKALCVYEELEELSGGFRNAIKKFDGKFPVSHLNFIMEDLGNTRAETRAPDGAGGSPDYVITIALNNNSNIHGVNYRPNLMTAKTIAHEVIHAEMFRKLLSVLDNGGNIAGVTRQNVLDALDGDFPGMYDYYRRHKNWQHQQMATHYRGSIADILKEFDNNQHSNQFYLDLAWEGLIYEQGDKAIYIWTSQPQDEKDRIKKVIKDYIENFKNENCQK